MDRCVECINYEVRPESVSLNHDNPSDFVQSQWPVSQKLYVIYRLLVSFLFIGWIASDVMYETQEFYSSRPWTYLIYATNWSLVLLMITVLLQAINTVYYSIRSGTCLDRQTFERMPHALKLQWFLQNLSYNSAIVVTVAYWSFIAFMDRSRVLQTEMSRLKHTLNTVYVIFDVMLSAAPWRIFHLLFTAGLGSVYSIFNAIYFLNDGTDGGGRHYAYNILDWNVPSEAIVTCALCVVFCIFSQVVIFGFYKFRMWLFSKFYFDSVNKPESEMQSIISETPGYMSIDNEKRGTIDAQ